MTLHQTIDRRVSVSQAMSNFAGLNADRRNALGRVASALEAAAYGGASFPAFVTDADFRVLEDFTKFLRRDFALVGVVGSDTAVDDQHGPDCYGHYLDLEKL